MPNRAETTEQTDTKDTMMALGGAALLIIGVGMMLTHPKIRQYASQVRLSSLLSAALPGIERLMRLRTA